MDLSPSWIIPLHHTECLFISSLSGCHPPPVRHRERELHPQSTPKELAIQFFAETSASQGNFYRPSRTLLTGNLWNTSAMPSSGACGGSYIKIPLTVHLPTHNIENDTFELGGINGGQGKGMKSQGRLVTTLWE